MTNHTREKEEKLLRKRVLLKRGEAAGQAGQIGSRKEVDEKRAQKKRLNCILRVSSRVSWGRGMVSQEGEGGRVVEH